MPELMTGRAAELAVAAVSVASGRPIAEIDVYIVLTFDVEDRPKISSNFCCSQHAIEGLRAVADQLEDLPDWQSLHVPE